MNIVMPMAGRGHRFVEAGIDVPKPLIDVRGRPMYAWATDGLPLDEANRLIFICLAEHLAGRALEADILTRYGDAVPGDRGAGRSYPGTGLHGPHGPASGSTTMSRC